MVRYLYVFSMLFFASEILACTCPENFDIEAKDKKAKYVFVGVLDSIHRFKSFSKNKYEFDSLKMYKGTADKIEAWSYKNSTSCGVDLTKGGSYLVFAFRDGDSLWIDRCSVWELNDSNAYYFDAVKDFYSKKAEEEK